jgi:hypothetical protein
MTKNDRSKWQGKDVAIATFVVSLVACGRMLATDAYTALEIKQVQVLDPGDCSVPADPTTLHRDKGTFDIALPDGIPRRYILPLSIVNNMVSFAGGGTASPATEMNEITLTHFTVELSGPSGVWSDACPAKFDTQAFSFVLAPAGTAGATVDALTPAHSLCLLPYVAAAPVVVTANIRAKGRHGGTTIESAPLVFPITVCAGCLQQNYGDPALVSYNYPNYPYCQSLAGSNPFLGDPCLSPGQNAKILCCGVTTTTTGGASQVTAICPGVFTGSTSTSTSTSTATSQ